MAILGTIDFRARKKAAWISCLTSFLVLGFKLFAYQQTHSLAILSDALESVVNVVTAIMALFVISYSAQPADDDHPYGHGKAEFFSAAFEGALIFFAGLMILIEAARGFSKTGHLQHLEMGALYVGVATILNLAVGIYLKKIGHKEKSETLVASGTHLLSDVKTTAVIIVGLLLVRWTGWEKLDLILAMLVGLHLLWEAFGIISRSIGGLIDRVDVKSIEELSKSMKEFRKPGVINIHNLKILRSGSFHHIDAHMSVPEYWDVARAHDLAHDFEHNVVNKYPFDGEFAFHLDPCQKAYCKMCDVQDCPIRVSPFEKLYSFDVKDIIQGPQKDS